MEPEILQRFLAIENMIQKFFDQQQTLNQHVSFHSPLEDEVKDDVHCIFRFLRHFCCWAI